MVIMSQNRRTSAHSFSPLNHNDMIPLARLDLSNLRISSRARFQFVCHFFKVGHKAVANFPA
jgi:hypothetical protein